MDDVKLRLLELPPGADDETLESGLKFLRLASRNSRLAARYLEMLDSILNRMTTRQGDTAKQGRATSTQARNMLPTPTTGFQVGTSNLDAFQWPEYLDTQDLLSGTGLPHDFLSLDWSLNARLS